MVATTHHPHVEPFRVTRRSDDLDTHVRRVVGYHAVCGDHWKGPVRGSWGAAADDLREHKAREHAHG